MLAVGEVFKLRTAHKCLQKCRESRLLSG